MFTGAHKVYRGLRKDLGIGAQGLRKRSAEKNFSIDSFNHARVGRGLRHFGDGGKCLVNGDPGSKEGFKLLEKEDSIFLSKI